MNSSKSGLSEGLVFYDMVLVHQWLVPSKHYDTRLLLLKLKQLYSSQTNTKRCNLFANIYSLTIIEPAHIRHLKQLLYIRGVVLKLQHTSKEQFTSAEC